ncbi:tyrosine-type recombinase/integrase [Erythrobacteraceae bacterium E2-1 Yellow Sea]|nr:tyrosine-type recombinase/integrase [Erythrobacteraceae bacterium E2-1 Yellow Sea]
MDLSRVKTRDALKCLPKGEPHWQRIRPGCFIGFAPSAKGGDGTWHARAYDPERRGYRRKALGSFPKEGGNTKFAAAKKEAEQFADTVESGGHSEEKIETVADACQAYAENRSEAEARFKRYIYDDKIAKVKLEKLRRRHLLDWRDRLGAQPALISRRKKGERQTRERAPSTVNRDMAVLRAALNKVLSPGKPNTEAAWQEALKPIRNANGRRTLYLDKVQRGKLLQHISDEARPFVRSLCLLPLRPGAMAALTVADFDARTSELTIGKDKSGKARRIKIPEQASNLFTVQSSDKLPAAPLFMRANGKAWDRNSWKIPIAEAAADAKLPAETVAYTLRHSTITDLVTAGLPLLTIAQISDTSAEMIERHYGHLVSDAAVNALEALAL